MTAQWLKDRAESYWRDSIVLDGEGDKAMAVAYRTIAEELRRAAENLGDGRMREPSSLRNGAES